MQIIEQFNGGVVQTKNIDTLAPGELAQANNVIYTPASDNLIVAPALGSPSTFATNSKQFGIYGIKFDNGNDYIVTLSQTHYKYATINPTSGALGALTTLSTHSSSTDRKNFNIVQYDNTYYLMDGVQRNLVLDDTLNVRPHGLQAVRTAIPTIITATAAGDVWPAQATGYFDYWYTEVYLDPVKGIDIESAYEATSVDGSAQNTDKEILTASVYVSALNTTARILLPQTPTNYNATHYRVYRSAAKTDTTDPGFPSGSLVAEIKIPVEASVLSAYVELTEGIITTSSWMYPTVVTSIAGLASLNPLANITDGSAGYSNSTYATASSAIGPNISVIDASVMCLNFNITSTVPTEPISEIEIAARGYGTNTFTAIQDELAANVRISVDGGTSWSSWRGMFFKNSTGAKSLDGSTGLVNWGRTFSLSDLTNANFKIQIRFVYGFGGINPYSGYFAGIHVDGIRMRVNYGSNGSIITKPYPGIVVTQGSKKYVCSRGGLPPVASVGTIFQGSLVTNDISDSSILRWSVPGEVEAFPSLYYLKVETPQNDKITFIGMVNNICIVGLQNSIIRLNYLPSEDDSNFERDKIFDFISTNLGIVNSRCAVTILTPTGRELLACVTVDGIYVTDGYTINKWDSRADFAIVTNILSIGTVNGDIYNCEDMQLTADTGTSNLILTYKSSSTSHVNLCFNYSPRHLLPGPELKFSGSWSGLSATNNGIHVSTYRSSKGNDFLFFLTNGATDASLKTLVNIRNLLYTQATSFVQFTTRQFLFNNSGEDSVINYVYLHNKGPINNLITIAPVTYLLNDSTVKTMTPVAFSDGYVSQADVPIEAYATSFIIRCTDANSLQQFNRMTIDFDRFGK